MEELLASQLVTPVVPRRFLSRVPRFVEAFREFLDTNETIAARARVSLDEQKTLQVAIHSEKMNPVADELCRRGLARRSGDKWYAIERAREEWYEVEQFTAHQYMAYLATALGRLDELGYVPATDSIQSLAALSSEPDAAKALLALRETLRASILEGLLPAPAGGISVSELVRFKSRYGEQLSRFRARVESLVLHVAESRDQLRDERMRLAQQELADEIEELQARMREWNWPRVSKGTFCSLVAGAIGGGSAAATGNVPAAAAALIGIAGVVYNAFAGSSQQREMMRSPLAYAALAQARLA